MTLTNKTIGIVLGAALLFSVAASVSAQTMTKEEQIQMLQAQLAALIAGKANMGFSADLTVGSSGTEVTRLQNFLMDRGYAIPAGATGYFGEQTRSALSRYQAASSIAPAVGFFGPITRTRVNAVLASTLPTTPPVVDEDDEDEDQDEDTDEADEGDADYALDKLEDSINDAANEIEDADDDGEDIGDAEDLLDEARNALDDGEEAFEDEDWEEAVERAEEGEDLVDEALDELDSSDNDDEELTDGGATARTEDVSGANNDYAVFEIEVVIEPFEQDVYISRNAADAFTYRIEDASDGTIVNTSTAETANISSDADSSGNYYRVEEGESETFTFTVTFNPVSADEGGTYRLQLLSVEYNDTAASPDQVWNATPSSDYETPSTYIND